MLPKVIYKDSGEKQGVLVAKLGDDLSEIESKISLDAKSQLVYNKFTNVKRKTEWLSVRYFLFKEFNISKVFYTVYGKPYIKNKPFTISFSHSKKHIGIAWNYEDNAVVDIQCESPKILKLKDRFASPKEILNEDTDKSRYYTLIWSAKECLYKYFEIGKVDLIKNFFVKPINVLSESGEIEATISKGKYFKLLKLNYIFFDGEAIVWA